ncbi:MAG: 3-isopropylmalate dehydratase small subunit [Gammaproteobacteria bacterium]|nr:3-isopropylmalate dehydratase small subunit [Gammaproteobacteria bacterium]
MEPFNKLRALVAPLDRHNVDTDAIIPKQFLKSIHRTGFGPNLFDEWRYLDRGEPGQDRAQRPLNPDFVLNQERYRGAQILLARDNFGCGSSREHAAWALLDYGIRCVIAPSFADIFFSNAHKNGLLPVILANSTIDGLFQNVAGTPGYELTVDLEAQTLATWDEHVIEFSMDASIKRRLMEGLDDIGITLQTAGLIRAYEQRRRQDAPWLFSEEIGSHGKFVLRRPSQA